MVWTAASVWSMQAACAYVRSLVTGKANPFQGFALPGIWYIRYTGGSTQPPSMRTVAHNLASEISCGACTRASSRYGSILAKVRHGAVFVFRKSYVSTQLLHAAHTDLATIVL